MVSVCGRQVPWEGFCATLSSNLNLYLEVAATLHTLSIIFFVLKQSLHSQTLL